jgi:hypothetical protein
VRWASDIHKSSICNLDEFVKSQFSHFPVIPAKAGIPDGTQRAMIRVKAPKE